MYRGDRGEVTQKDLISFYCMYGKIADCLADPGAGAGRGERIEVLRPGMNFELHLQELKYASTSPIMGS